MNMLSALLPLVLAATSLASISTSNGTANIFNDAFHARIESLLAQNSVPGSAIAVIQPGAQIPVQFGSWGNRTETGDKFDEKTIMGLGSMSKEFTATALGLVMDDFAHGRNVTALPRGLKTFNWDTKVKDILPGEWKLMDDFASEKASIRDILSHLSGLPRHDLSYGRGVPVVDAIRGLRNLRSAYELREQWYYINLHYGTAQYIIEKYSKTSLEEFVGQRIFAPLNMTDTTYDLAKAQASGRCSESYESSGRRIPHWIQPADLALIAGAGGIMSTATDLAQWSKLLLGAIDGNAIGIPTSIFSAIEAPHALVSADESRMTYGMGFFQQDVQGMPMIFHPGEIPGVSSLISFLPHQKVAVVLLMPADGKDNVIQQILGEIYAAVLGSGAPATTPSQRARLKILKTSAHPTNPSASTKVQSSTDVETLAGTYTDAGYGTIVLCSAAHPSNDCKSVLGNYSTLGPLGNDSVYGYFSPEKFWAKTISLTPTTSSNLSSVEGTTQTFVFQATTIFPEGYGANKTAVEYSYTRKLDVRAEFMRGGDGKVKGFGLFGLAGPVLEREVEGGTIEEKAEVWFTKHK